MSFPNNPKSNPPKAHPLMSHQLGHSQKHHFPSHSTLSLALNKCDACVLPRFPAYSSASWERTKWSTPQMRISPTYGDTPHRPHPQVPWWSPSTGTYKQTNQPFREVFFVVKKYPNKNMVGSFILFFERVETEKTGEKILDVRYSMTFTYLW